MRYLRLGLFAGALGSVLATDVSAVQAGDPGSHCAGGCGTVFSLDLNTGAEKVLHSFQKDGTDGTSPVSRLTEIGSMLYGTTETGGDRVGTVFAIDRRTGAESIVHTFTAGADGIYPEAGLKKMGGLLYGTTSYGGSTGCGSSGCGTVFSIDPATGKETVLHSFKGNPTDGAIPEDELIEVNGILYGTTLAGGSGTCDCGTVFSIDPATGEEKVLYSFTFGSDGAYPYARVTNVAGTLYGTTPEGGNSSNGGTLYSLDPATGRETVLYDFGSGGGSVPFSGLIEVDGLLYGTTCNGGDKNAGTVFSFDPATGKETVLHSFQGNMTDGNCPWGDLINVAGALYGTTEYGGPYNRGTLFSITTSGSEATLFGFEGKDGAVPAARLRYIRGKLYGTTAEGGRRQE